MRDGDSFLLVAIYVVDLILAGTSMADLEGLKLALGSRSKMKDLGEPKRFLGMEIRRDRSTRRTYLSQPKYVEDTLERFNMADAKAARLPMDPGLVLSKEQCAVTDNERLQMETVPYRNLIGCSMYILNCTRPNIAFAVGKLSRYLANPDEAHWKAAKHLLRYLTGIVNASLVRCKWFGDSTRSWISRC